MQKNLIRSVFAAAALTAFLAGGIPAAYAEMNSYKADLKGSAEVPPTDSKGVGTVDATYDTASKKLSWTVTYSGLTGPATAAHFHGPAAATAAAGPWKCAARGAAHRQPDEPDQGRRDAHRRSGNRSEGRHHVLQCSHRRQ
jgi:hypothetical protein